MLRYPVKLVKDTNETILVDVPDIPEAHTFGEDREEALLRAPDAIESALMCYIDLRREIPVPRATRKGPPALTEAKLALYTALRATRIGKAETLPAAQLPLAPGRSPARSPARLPARPTGGGFPRAG